MIYILRYFVNNRSVTELTMVYSCLRSSNLTKEWSRNSFIHEFEGYIQRGQVSSNGFKVFKSCIVEYLNLLVRLPVRCD